MNVRETLASYRNMSEVACLEFPMRLPFMLIYNFSIVLSSLSGSRAFSHYDNAATSHRWEVICNDFAVLFDEL